MSKGKPQYPSAKESLFVIADALMVISYHMAAYSKHNDIPLEIFGHQNCPICNE